MAVIPRRQQVVRDRGQQAAGKRRIVPIDSRLEPVVALLDAGRPPPVLLDRRPQGPAGPSAGTGYATGTPGPAGCDC